MKYFKIIHLLPIPLIQSCLFFTFSGSAISNKIKTFSLDIKSEITNGPSNMINLFQEQFSNCLIQKNHINQIDNGGDIIFDCVIKKFDKSLVTGTDGNKVKISMTVEVTYKNIYNKDFEFEKNSFSDDSEVDSSNANDDEDNAKIIIKKVIDKIYNKSITVW